MSITSDLVWDIHSELFFVSDGFGPKTRARSKNPGQARPISLFFVTFLLMKEEEAQQTLLKLEYSSLEFYYNTSNDETLWSIVKKNYNTLHSALKLEKKCNFKSTKTHFLHFQKWQKINFCTRNKFRITKHPFFQSQNCIFGSFKLYSCVKIDFLPF